MLNDWGECNRAIAIIEQLKKISPNFRKISAGHRIAAGAYIDADMLDSISIHISRYDSSRQLSVFSDRSSLAKKFMELGNYDMSLKIWESCNNLLTNDRKLETITLGFTRLVVWSLENVPLAQSTKKLDALLEPWSHVAQSNWIIFRINSSRLLQSLVLPANHRQKMQLLFSRILQICRNSDKCTDEIQKKFQSFFYENTGQYEKVLNHLQSTPAAPWRNNPDSLNQMSYLFDFENAKIAILQHELGNYNEAIAIRRMLLKKVLPYADVLPETVTDIKIRLAESLAAIGKRNEAEMLLKEAIRTFERFPISGVSARHKRAKTALTKLTQGETDVAPHGIAATRFSR